jgi:hypothetical protein
MRVEDCSDEEQVDSPRQSFEDVGVKLSLGPRNCCREKDPVPRRHPVALT